MSARPTLALGRPGAGEAARASASRGWPASATSSAARWPRRSPLDTVAACLARRTVAAVLVVTDDARSRARAGRRSAARSIPDGVTDDLNGTLARPRPRRGRRWPELRRSRCAPTCRAAAGRPRRGARRGRPPARRRSSRDAAGPGRRSTPRRTRRFDPRFGAGLARRAPRRRARREIDAAALAVAAPRRRRPRRPGARRSPLGRRARSTAVALGQRRPLADTRRRAASRRVTAPSDDAVAQDFLRGLLGRCLLGRCVFFAGAFFAGAFFAARLLGGCLLRGLLGAVRLLGRPPSSRGAFLAAVFLAGAFFAGAFLAGALLGRRLLRRRLLRRRGLLGRGLLGRCLLRRPSWPAFLAGVFAADAAFLRREPSPSWPAAARPRQRQLRQLLGAGDDVLEVGAGGELRHRRLLGLDALAGLRVAHPAGLADALLERAEAGDGDLLALGDLAGDRVEHGLERVRRRLAVPLVTRGERVDEL